MKTTVKILATACVLALVSCSKEQVNDNKAKVITDFPVVEVLGDVDEPTVDGGAAASSSPATKIFGTESEEGKHTVKWKAGDQISMFGVIFSDNAYAAKGTVLNFSHLRSSLKYGDETKTFTFVIPDMMTKYGASSGVTSHLCAIYPATTFSDITAEFPDPTNKPNAYNVTATPEKLTIPSEQDGTGWKYSVFIARSSTLSAQYNNPTGGGGITFHLMSSLFRLKLNSSKDITKVVLTSSTGFMVGDVTKINMGSFHYATDVNKNFTLSEGCSGKTLTVENGGDVLPNDLYFAVREMREGTTYTFTFTAKDGTTATRSLTNPADYANRKIRKVLSLGTVTLTDTDFN